MAVVAGPVGGVEREYRCVDDRGDGFLFAGEGLLLGISLERGNASPGWRREQEALWPRDWEQQILMGKVLPPRGARGFVAVLNKHARKGK